MASTATNKQPLLVDRVFHEVQQANTLASGSATDLNILGTNESAVLVNCATNDGGIIEDLYVISRSADTAYKILIYFSTASDYLRPAEATYIGSVTSAATLGTVTHFADLPNVLAPLPNTGTDAQVGALYVPKGKNVWISLQAVTSSGLATTPIVGAQGGFY